MWKSSMNKGAKIRNIAVIGTFKELGFLVPSS